MDKKLDGYLLIDKPLNWTSFDVVNKVRFKLANELGVRPKSLKVGHAGTLDPLATGLLIVLVGGYTKKQSEFMKQDKTYKAEIILGQTSETDDEEGEKTDISGRQPAEEEVIGVLEGFTGKIEQTPPAYSAVKVGGRPAYSRARAEQKVKLEPKTVKIFKFADIDYKYPRVKLVCRVSSGTYIRSLARDIGNELKTGAYLHSLRRTRIGGYKIEDAVSAELLDKESIRDLLLRQS